MTILSVESISKQYGPRPLFREVSFGMLKGERLGIIGVNGSGKTTLLRVVAGLEPPDSGRVTTANGVHIAYLPQTPELPAGASVLDAVFAGESPTLRLLRSYEHVSAALAARPDDQALIEQIGALTPQMDAIGAWEAEAAARSIIHELGLAEHIDALVGTLSGGQRKRVAMARALVDQPDLLILDEPTNHIDTDTIAWLEDYLARIPTALLLITHDRYFLERLVGRMLELDRGSVYSYQGNYQRYLEQKAERIAREASAEEARQNLLRKELAWLRRGARARTTKQKSHVERVYDLIEQRPDAAQGSVAIDLAYGRRLGKRVLELKGLSKGYGQRALIRALSLEIRPGDRVGIVGPNGSGKTTLLNMIAGRVAPDSGELIVGETVHMAYYDQEAAGLNEGLRVVDYIREAAELIRGREGALLAATQMLERFLFTPEQQWALVGTLSGGERRRLYLLRQLIEAPNLLLLDEPTNDLDLQTLTVLEDYLDDFQGSVVAVSHDRYFLDRVVTRTFAFEGEGRIVEYPGGYSMYVQHRAARPTPEAERGAARRPAPAQGKGAARQPAPPRAGSQAGSGAAKGAQPAGKLTVSVLASAPRLTATSRRSPVASSRRWKIR
ncbi:MAG: ATP-binding cassette domain-containing protein [Chloroflexales bacterium]|nr:ATP-binding cassette domain-containing protein [Chloroflexales bacterium]